MTTCGYCGQEMIGKAGATWKGEMVDLCHDERRDCYHVVTVYGGDWASFARTLKFKEQTEFMQTGRLARWGMRAR
jgi:hypothetical protein